MSVVTGTGSPASLPAGARSREHAVEHQRVDVDVEVQRPAEPLDDRHGAATRSLETRGARVVPQLAEHGAEEHGAHPPAQIVVPRQPVPEPVRQTQDPLSHRHVGKDMIHEMCGPLRHPPSLQLGQSARPLHENGTSRSRPQSPQ